MTKTKNKNKEQWPIRQPEGCKCEGVGWEHVEEVPPICEEHQGDFDDCSRCDHWRECHKETGK